MKRQQVILELIVFLFILLFLYAAGIKLSEYQKFVGQIGMSPLITKYATIIAWMIPTMEIVISIILMVPKFRVVGLYAAFGLMMMFTFYIIAIFTISDKLPCACGGVLSMLGWKGHLIFNIGCDFLAILGIVLTLRIKKTVDDGDRRRIVPA